MSFHQQLREFLIFILKGIDNLVVFLKSLLWSGRAAACLHSIQAEEVVQLAT